ncbi:MAG: FG-GAP repeat domain-containing protein, partial [Planctomycetota bacterium]
MRAPGGPATLAALLAALLALSACGSREDEPSPAPPVPTTEATQPPGPDPDDLFADVSERAGVVFVHHVGDEEMDNIVESIGSGALCFDYDGDGWLDLYLIDQGWRDGVSKPPRPADTHVNRLFRNRGDGTFEDVTVAAGVGDEGFGFSAAAADYDNDGDTDLYVL